MRGVFRAREAKHQGDGCKGSLRRVECSRENGGSLPRKKVMKLVEERIGPTLTKLEREIIGTTRRYPRWEGSLIRSTEFVKAGFLAKNNGQWRITPEGVEALKLREINLLEEANEKYKAWEKSRM